MRRFLVAAGVVVLVAVTGCTADSSHDERRRPCPTPVLTPPRHRRQRRQPDIFGRPTIPAPGAKAEDC